jgi:hypothetical protein
MQKAGERSQFSLNIYIYILGPRRGRVGKLVGSLHIYVEAVLVLFCSVLLIRKWHQLTVNVKHIQYIKYPSKRASCLLRRMRVA